MDSSDFWLKAGKEMGFTGQSLDNYITAKIAIVKKEEQEKERERLAREEKKEQERLAREEKKEQERLAFEEKRLAREEKKEQERLAREEKRLAREEKKEQERLAREDKLEQERIAREDRVQAKQRELEQSRLELEAKKIELSKQKIDEGVLEYPSQEPNIRMPQIPPFSEQDDIAAYITRFESTATLCDWPADSWATRLGLLLSGSALNVYSTLPSDVISSYSLLKKAILQAFKKTTHHYRSEFRHIKITPN
ncbi:uncharacterized protein [Cherax quadricarinatus]|uniref:uncharacterized protein isoform X1 n=1 Tax=Cherax quadricarinatus TaxID=27406 RepID=UPI00387EA83E